MLPIIPLGLLGLMVAWIVNYLADVLPIWRRLTTPRCPNCEAAQSLLIHPWWPRRCPQCGHQHSQFWRSLSVNLFAIGTTVWLWFSPPDKLGFLWGTAVMAYFLLVVVIDVEHRLILHSVSALGLVLGLIVGTQENGFLNSLLGGLVGFGLMFLMYKFGELFIRTISRLRGDPLDEVALGFGDVNLAGVLGLMLGWPVILIGVIMGILIGGAFSFLYLILSVLLRRYQRFAALPYAPFLVLSATLLLYFPEPTRAFLLP